MSISSSSRYDRLVPASICVPGSPTAESVVSDLSTYGKKIPKETDCERDNDRDAILPADAMKKGTARERRQSRMKKEYMDVVALTDRDRLKIIQARSKVARLTLGQIQEELERSKIEKEAELVATRSSRNEIKIVDDLGTLVIDKKDEKTLNKKYEKKAVETDKRVKKPASQKNLKTISSECKVQKRKSKAKDPSPTIDRTDSCQVERKEVSRGRELRDEKASTHASITGSIRRSLSIRKLESRKPSSGSEQKLAKEEIKPKKIAPIIHNVDDESAAARTATTSKTDSTDKTSQDDESIAQSQSAATSSLFPALFRGVRLSKDNVKATKKKTKQRVVQVTVRHTDPSKEATVAINESWILAREEEMKTIAGEKNLSTSRWNGSLLFCRLHEAKWRSRGNVRSKLRTEQNCLKIDISPVEDMGRGINPDVIHFIAKFYESGIIKMTDEVPGHDVYEALDYFGILHSGNKITFDSFGSCMHVHIWSNYLSYRDALAKYIVRKCVAKPQFRQIFFTSPEAAGETSYFSDGKRCELFDGGLETDDSDTSCSVVHSLFSAQAGDDTVSQREDDIASLKRQDFCNFLQKSLQGTSVAFEMGDVQAKGRSSPSSLHCFRSAVLRIYCVGGSKGEIQKTPVITKSESKDEFVAKLEDDKTYETNADSAIGNTPKEPEKPLPEEPEKPLSKEPEKSLPKEPEKSLPKEPEKSLPKENKASVVFEKFDEKSNNLGKSQNNSKTTNPDNLNECEKVEKVKATLKEVDCLKCAKTLPGWLPEKAEDNPFQAVVLFLEDFFALKELNTPQNEDVKIKEAHGKEVLREQTIHSAETNNVSVTDDKSSATSQPRASFKLGGLPVEQLNSAWLRDAMQFPFSCVDQITSSSERVISCFESPEPQSKQQPTKDM